MGRCVAAQPRSVAPAGSAGLVGLCRSESIALGHSLGMQAGATPRHLSENFKEVHWDGEFLYKKGGAWV